MRQRCSGVNFRLVQRGLEGLLGRIPDFAALRTGWDRFPQKCMKRRWVFHALQRLMSAFSHYFCNFSDLKYDDLCSV